MPTRTAPDTAPHTLSVPLDISLDIRPRPTLLPGIVVLDVAGEVDESNCRALLTAVEAARLETGNMADQNVVLNVSEVHFISSAGFGILIAIERRLHDAGTGRLRLVAPQNNVARSLAITGLSRVFLVYGTEAQALEACSSTRAI